jgi:hypothetical protein
MIGFSNAYLNENRMINDIKNVIECEQIMDDEDINWSYPNYSRKLFNLAELLEQEKPELPIV